MNQISLLVGLGNPGNRYERTRHNAGFWFIDEVARQQGVVLAWNGRFGGWSGQFHHRNELVRLFKPGQFMNRSGGPVAAVCHYYRIEAEKILVAHDELDFEPGVVKLKSGGGHGGHNGLRSVIDHLGSPQFHRLRIGIGRPKLGTVTDYVLSCPSAEEVAKIHEAIDHAIECLPQIVEQGVNKAMNLLHAHPG